jgi:hypothetical protein
MASLSIRTRETTRSTTIKHCGRGPDPPRGAREPRPSARELLAQGSGMMIRADLRALGFDRRAIDAIFRELPNVLLPGDSRPLVRVEDYLQLADESIFREDRVWPPVG